jgi:hypothetical protein
MIIICSGSSNSFIIGIKGEVNCIFGAKTAGFVIVLKKLGFLKGTPFESWVKIPGQSVWGFLVDELVLGQVFLRMLRSSFVTSIPVLLHVH